MYSASENRKYYIKIGICPVCKKNHPEEGYKICHDCRIKMNRRNMAWRHKNREQYNTKIASRRKMIYEDRVVKGICTRCGKRPAEDGMRTCRQCHPTYHARRVRMVANTYPGVCYQCGERAIPGMRLCKEHYRRLTGKDWDEIYKDVPEDMGEN